jgi:hypothetical protein
MLIKKVSSESWLKNFQQNNLDENVFNRTISISIYKITFTAFANSHGHLLESVVISDL